MVQVNPRQHPGPDRLVEGTTLKRAIRHAEANDLVSRNVATLADTPRGQGAGRPSR
jgi:hypothetical protein